MATYTVGLVKHENTEAQELGVFTSESEARQTVETALNKLYSDDWERVNDGQYARKGARMWEHNKLVAYLIEDLTERETMERELGKWEKKVARLKQELEEAERAVEGWRTRIASITD